MTTDAVGGVWDYSLELCRALRPFDIEILLATMGPLPRPDQRAAAAALSHVTLRESRFRLEWMDAPWDDVERAGEWLMELERRFRPEIIHLNGYAHAALAWSVPTLIVAHSEVGSWWRAVRGGDAPADWGRYRSAVQAGLAAADTVVAPSRAMLDALEFEYGRLRRAGVIANACACDDFEPTRKERWVLSVGRLWDEAKNAMTLAAAASRLSWPVRLVGDTTLPDGAAASASESWPNVELLGRRPREEVVRLYRQAAIYALPARYEPFGLSVLEAAHAGCALVLGDIPSLRENWDEAAVFVPPNERDCLVAAVERLVNDDQLRAIFGERARHRAATYTVDKMAAQYVATYARMLTSRSSHGSPRPEPLEIDA